MKVKYIIGIRVALRRYYTFYKSVMDKEVDTLSISDLTLLKCVSSSSITTALKKHSKIEVLRDVKQNTVTKLSNKDIAQMYLRTCSDEDYEKITGVKRQH